MTTATASRAALDEGFRFAGLYARRRRVVRVALVAPDGALRLESVAGTGRRASRRSSTSPRPPVGTSARLPTCTACASTATSRCDRSSSTTSTFVHWTVPVRGDDAYQVAVGPIHAGVIESGHFRFHVVGDKILHLDARLFYKHRGLERAAEGRIA